MVPLATDSTINLPTKCGRGAADFGRRPYDDNNEATANKSESYWLFATYEMRLDHNFFDRFADDMKTVEHNLETMYACGHNRRGKPPHDSARRSDMLDTH